MDDDIGSDIQAFSHDGGHLVVAPRNLEVLVFIQGRNNTTSADTGHHVQCVGDLRGRKPMKRFGIRFDELERESQVSWFNAQSPLKIPAVALQPGAGPMYLAVN